VSTCFMNCVNTLNWKSSNMTKIFPRSVLDSEDTNYTPVGDQMWCGIGPLQNRGRMFVRIFYNPHGSQSKNSENFLFIYIR
jgi:hypothetical protein